MSTAVKRRKRAAPRPKPALTGVSDVRRFFYNDPTPTWFVSATPFNLLGMHEWVRDFRYVNYIDCFDGKHERILVPRDVAHEGFTSIEDIVNYLLGHKEVHDAVKARGRGRAVFLMFDDDSEQLARDLGLDICFPPAKLRQDVDNKVIATRIGDRAGVPSVPNALGKVTSYPDLLKLAKKLGDDLVVQTAFGDSGHTTFFIKNQADYAKHAAEIEREPEVKVMRRIRCRSIAMEACVTRHGTVVAPPMPELVGFAELTPYRGGWCGNELRPGGLAPRLEQKARRALVAFGDELRRIGYRGYFEIDWLHDLDRDELYLGEVNPRITGASLLTNLAAFAHADAPLFLFHLLEHAGVDYDLDVDAINARWARPEYIDGWGQLVIKHVQDSVDRVRAAPPSGVWRLEDGRVSFVRSELHRRAARGANEAFFLRITGEGDYRYPGADLGILLTPGELTAGGELSAAARAWISGIRGAYRGEPLAQGDEPVTDRTAKLGRFKIF